MNCLIVVPHFQHLAHLRKFLPTLLETLPDNFDILISDDGSGESVTTALTKYLNEERANLEGTRPTILHPLLAPKNRGKGNAVHWAWKMLGDSYDWLAFVDADGAVPASEILRAWNHLALQGNKMDALLASRVAMLGMNVVRTPTRHYAGRIFATIVSFATGLKIYDSQCGLKFVRASEYAKIKGAVSSAGLAFDVELIDLLAKNHSKLEEFPIHWKDVKGGKVKVWKNSLPMIWEVLKTCRHRRG